MITHDIESESLPAHVSICQERYQALEHRLDQVEHKITEIHQILRDIRDDLQDMREHHARRWDTAQIAIIAVLMSLVGALASHVLLN